MLQQQLQLLEQPVQKQPQGQQRLPPGVPLGCIFEQRLESSESNPLMFLREACFDSEASSPGGARPTGSDEHLSSGQVAIFSALLCSSPWIVCFPEAQLGQGLPRAWSLSGENQVQVWKDLKWRELFKFLVCQLSLELCFVRD